MSNSQSTSLAEPAIDSTETIGQFVMGLAFNYGSLSATFAGNSALVRFHWEPGRQYLVQRNACGMGFDVIQLEAVAA